MPRILTHRKQAWINNFRPDLIRGDALAPNAAVAARYQATLENMIKELVEETEKEIRALFKSETAREFFAADASVASQARIVSNMLRTKFIGLFAGNSKTVAEAFARQSDRASSKSVYLSIQKLSGGLSLPTSAMNDDLTEIFKATVSENVSLIKSIPQKYLGAVEQAVMRSITTGNGLQDLVPYLQKQGRSTYARAKNIALDQTRKAFQGMSHERLDQLGLTEGEWIHVPSNHPRKTHEAMNGKIYNLKKGIYDPAVKKYIMPAELPFCRCMTRPVITFGD